MNNIFVDSSFWIAVADSTEKNHTRSLKLLKEFKKSKNLLVTTNFILDETFTLIRKRQGISRVIEFRNVIAKFGWQLRLERVIVADEESVWKWFVRDIEKLSYTDCTSFAVMGRLGINKVATFDEDFSKVGFEIV
jgi:predicted nucleic acid-binding protein